VALVKLADSLPVQCPCDRQSYGVYKRNWTDPVVESAVPGKSRLS